MDQAARQKRQDPRLRTEQGVVFLRSKGVPSLACKLLDISLNGCRCIASPKSLDLEVAKRWRAALEPGHEIFLVVSAPPHLPGLHLDSEVRHAKPLSDGDFDIGLRFRNVESAERNSLTEAMVALAYKKLGADKSSPMQLADAEPPLTETAALPRTASFRAESTVLMNTGAASVSAAPQKGRQLSAFTPQKQGTSTDHFRGKRLGEILVSLGKLRENDVVEAQAVTRSAGEKLGRYLLRSGWITPMDLCSALSLQSDLPIYDLTDLKALPSLSISFPYLTMLKYEFVPVEETSTNVLVAAAHPLSPRLLDDLKKRCGKTITVYLAEDDLVMNLLYSMQPAKDRKLRKSTRYTLSVPIEFRFYNRQLGSLGEKVYAGRTINISESGFMIALTDDLRRYGTAVRVSFELAPQRVEALCSIRYIRDISSAGLTKLPWTLGLQIVEMSSMDRSELKQICIRTGMWNMQDTKRSR
jgi:hypothetical protein